MKRILVILSAGLLYGCPTVPPSAALLKACAETPRLEIREVRPASTLLFANVQYALGFLEQRLATAQQPCLRCIDVLLERDYEAIEYPLSPEDEKQPAAAQVVGRHALAPTGDPRCAWRRAAPFHYGLRFWVREPANRCVTLESGPRRSTLMLEEIREPVGGVESQTYRVVEIATGRELGRSTDFVQRNGELAANRCDGRHNDHARRQVLDTLVAAPPLTETRSGAD